MKIGIMGGTFNPIHNAHLMMAQAAYEQYKLDEIWFMPSAKPPHKNQDEIAEKEHRKRMVQFAIDKTPYFKYSNVEYKREGKTYTYDTLVELKKEREDAHFYFIMGGDSLAQFEQWYHPEKIVKSNQIVSKAIQLVKQRFQENITLDIVAEELGVSSFYLSKLFHKHTGMNFTEYLTQKRIAQAKRMLENGEMNIKEIAYATGFNSQSYFSKIFKKYVGIAPSDYKGADDASE